jgi:hypothetical protein
MKKITQQSLKCYFLILILVVFISACKEEKQVDIVKEPYTDVQTKITGMLTDIFNSAKAGDFAKLDAFHLNSPKFTKFDVDGSPNRQTYIENKLGEEAAFKMLEGFYFKLSDIKVDVFDKVAISTFTISYSAKVQGKPVADVGHGTLVFVNYEDKWRITHEHFSKFKQ